MMILDKLTNMSSKDRIVYKNVFGAFSIKGLALILSLFTMPAYMNFFSNQKVLGVWFTVLSILTWILNFDIGIGNGLRNKLTSAFALHDLKKAKEYISSAYSIIGVFVIILFCIGNFMIPNINWNSFFNISEHLIPYESTVIIVRYVFLGIMLQFFLRLISSVIYAMQKAAINNLIALMTSALQLMFVLIAPSLSPVENLIMFSIAYVFCANLPLLIASLIIFFKYLKTCKPNIRYFRFKTANAILSLGGIFFVCQILYMIIANTNEFLITQYTDPGNVVEYQIYNKLFTLGSVVFMLALTPIWSAVSKAIAEKDYEWLKKLYKNLKKLAFFGCIVEFSIIAFLQLIINLWLGKQALEVNYFYAFSFAAFGSIMIFQSALSTIANGTGKLKIQLCFYAIAVLLKFIIVSIGFKYCDDWIVVVLSNFIVLLPYCIVQTKFLNKMILMLE